MYFTNISTVVKIQLRSLLPTMLAEMRKTLVEQPPSQTSYGTTRKHQIATVKGFARELKILDEVSDGEIGWRELVVASLTNGVSGAARLHEERTGGRPEDDAGGYVEGARCVAENRLGGVLFTDS